VDICSFFQCSVEESPLEEQQVSPCAIPDRLGDFVRDLQHLGGDVALHEEQVTDRRIQKTKNLLHEALAARGRSAETGPQLVLSPLEVTPIFENRRSSTGC
jgi:hypothetical protein